MKFEIKQRPHHNIKKYNHSEFDIAKRFSQELEKELGQFVKAVVLFGSSARGESKARVSDVDVLLIINDLTIILNKEVVEAYRIIVHNVASKVSKRLHITTQKLSTFWDYMRKGDPIALNMLRDGMPLLDRGFFEPLQFLLHQGKIRPSEESVWTYFARAPTTLLNSRWHILQASVDLYWAVIDAAHAALMHLGHVPPTPAHMASAISTHLVKEKHVHAKYASEMKFFYELSKKINHREIAKISGKDFDGYQKRAKDFVEVMQKVIEKTPPKRDW